MRIGFDVSQTCQERAGCAWYADSLAQAMIRYAPEHDYILYHQFANWINSDTSKGTHSSQKNVTSPFFKKSHGQSTNAWGKILAGKSLPGTPDIVHSTSFQAPKLRKTKLVFTIYDLSFWIVPEYATEENRQACQKGMLQALNNADGFAFISKSTKNEFELIFPNWLENSKRPWAVTPLGPRLPQNTKSLFNFSENLISPGSYWLSVGSLEPRKNIARLLDAHEVYWHQSAHKYPLVIAGGNGWKSDAIKKRIQEMASRGLVIPLGYISDVFLPQLYREATALVFTSLYEGFGLPILEAINHECPVLAGNNTSLIEVAGDALLEFDPYDCQSIASAMLTFEANPCLGEKLKTNGVAQAKQFSWEITAKSTLELYRSVVKAN